MGGFIYYGFPDPPVGGYCTVLLYRFQQIISGFLLNFVDSFQFPLKM